MLNLRDTKNRTAVYANSSYFPQSKDEAKADLRKIRSHNKSKCIAEIPSIGNKGGMIDYSWLAGASQTYNISPNIEDYVITEVPIVTVDFPNRNLHCFPFSEVSYFDPRFGCFVYQTFRGKPTFADHDNSDPTKAKGIHFDASLRKVPGWNIWKIYVLIGYDRTRDYALARSIEKGDRRGYSMGAWVSYFVNSISGQMMNGNQSPKYPPGSVYQGRLSYSNCSGIEYFETSSVEGPADVTAESHQLWYF